MGLEFVQRQIDTLKALDEAHTRLRQAIVGFVRAVNALPVELRAKVLAEVAPDGRIPINSEQKPVPLAQQATEHVSLFDLADAVDPVEEQKSPRQVIIDALRQHPLGMTLPDLITYCRGKYRTASKNPDHMLRTVIGQMVKDRDLKKEGEVITALPWAGVDM